MWALAATLALAACATTPAPAPAPPVVTSPPPVVEAPPPPPADAVPAADGATLAATDLYKIELELGGCAAGATCEARLVVHALGGYHVNAEYPTKFVVDPAAAPIVEGSVFSATDPEKGILTIKLHPAAAGTVRVGGTLKLAVCTEEICEIKAAQIAFDVPVTAPAS